MLDEPACGRFGVWVRRRKLFRSMEFVTSRRADDETISNRSRYQCGRNPSARIEPIRNSTSMDLSHIDIVGVVFQYIAFLFAISVHESAHAWTANRCGDPTARMLGRITLNPIKHIDPVGTVLMPLIALFTGFPVLGWAKPTPVNPSNFRNPVRDDILTSVVGPISNFVVAVGVLFVLALLSLTSRTGHYL